MTLRQFRPHTLRVKDPLGIEHIATFNSRGFLNKFTAGISQCFLLSTRDGIRMLGVMVINPRVKSSDQRRVINGVFRCIESCTGDHYIGHACLLIAASRHIAETVSKIAYGGDVYPALSKPKRLLV